jgi:hypothetical protein
MYNQHSSQNYKENNKIISFLTFHTKSQNKVYLLSVIPKQKQKQKNIFGSTRLESTMCFSLTIHLKQYIIILNDTTVHFDALLTKTAYRFKTKSGHMYYYFIQQKANDL